MSQLAEPKHQTVISTEEDEVRSTIHADNYGLVRLRLSLFLSIMTVLGIAAFGSTAFAAENLRVLTWHGYANEEWIKPFEEEHDVKVERTYVGSNDEYMTKLAAGARYDVVVIVSSLAQPAIQPGFVQPLDLRKIPNFTKLAKGFQNLNFLQDAEGNIYGVPTFWGTDPVVVNADVVDMSQYDHVYDVLWDEQYKGKIAMWDDVATLGEVVGHYLDFDNIWTMSEKQLEQVKQKMIEQKPLIRTYWSDPGDVIELFLSGEIVATNGWNFVTQALKDEGFPAEEYNPDPAVGFVDSHFIVAGSDNVDLAHTFINHMIDAEMQARIAKGSGYSVTNPNSKQYMDEKLWERLYTKDAATMLEEMKFWEEIPNRSRYIEIWDEVKAH